jgi:outer membrane protein assembly factor BamB
MADTSIPSIQTGRRMMVRGATGARAKPSVARRPLLLTVVAAAVATATLAPAGTANADWTQYRGDKTRSGRASWLGPGPSIGTAAPRGRLLWRRFIGRPGENNEPAIQASAPIIGPDGTVYVGAARPAPDHLYAYRPDGKLRWSTDLQGYSVYGTPALRSDGRMLVVGDRFRPDLPHVQRAFVVNTRDGSIAARTPVTETMGGSPLVNARGDFFYRDGDAVWKIPHSDHRSRPSSKLVARHVYPVTGGPGIADFLSAVWEGLSECFPGCDFDRTGPPALAFPVGKYLPSPAISSCGDLVSPLREYLQRRWGDLFGNEAEAAAVSTPAVGQGGRGYVALEGQHLAAYEQNGEEGWKKKWPSQPVSIAIGHPRTLNLVRSECQFLDRGGRLVTQVREERFRDRLFVLLGDGRLAAVDPLAKVGRTVWIKEAPRKLVGEPAVVATASGEQVLVSGIGRLYAFDARDGEELWSVRLDSRALGSPAVADGRIYVATRTSLWAIR